MFITKPAFTIEHLQVLNTLNSDHNPVIIEIDNNPHRIHFTNKIIVNTDWPKYRQILNDSLNTQEELDTAVQTFQNTLTDAYHKATTKTYPNIREEEIPGLSGLLKEKRRIRKSWQRD